MRRGIKLALLVLLSFALGTSAFLAGKPTFRLVFLVLYLPIAVVLLPGEVIDLIMDRLPSQSSSGGGGAGKLIGYSERSFFALLCTLSVLSAPPEGRVSAFSEAIKVFSLIIALKGLYRFGDKERADRYILGSLLSLTLAVALSLPVLFVPSN